MTTSAIPQGSLGVDFDCGLDCSTNLTNYGLMIPLFLVILFAFVVFASIALLANYTVRGKARPLVSDAQRQRTGIGIRLRKQIGWMQAARSSLHESPTTQCRIRNLELHIIQPSKSTAWF